MDKYQIEELKDFLIDNIYENDDLIATSGEPVRTARLRGKREAFKLVLSELKKYE